MLLIALQTLNYARAALTYDLSADSWSNWKLIEGFTKAGPGATVVGNELQVVVLGTDDWLYDGHVDLSTLIFSGWVVIDGLTPSAPALTS